MEMDMQRDSLEKKTAPVAHDGDHFHIQAALHHMM